MVGTEFLGFFGAGILGGEGGLCPHVNKGGVPLSCSFFHPCVKHLFFCVATVKIMVIPSVDNLCLTNQLNK